MTKWIPRKPNTEHKPCENTKQSEWIERIEVDIAFLYQVVEEALLIIYLWGEEWEEAKEKDTLTFSGQNSGSSQIRGSKAKVWEWASSLPAKVKEMDK